MIEDVLIELVHNVVSEVAVDVANTLHQEMEANVSSYLSLSLSLKSML